MKKVVDMSIPRAYKRHTFTCCCELGARERAWFGSRFGMGKRVGTGAVAGFSNARLHNDKQAFAWPGPELLELGAGLGVGLIGP